MADDVVLVSPVKRGAAASRSRKTPPVSKKTVARGLKPNSIFDFDPVIELSDSDSEDEIRAYHHAFSSKFKPPARRPGSQAQKKDDNKAPAVAGSSRTRHLLQPNVVIDNKAAMPAVARPPRQDPLFLPSDEENDPPAPTRDVRPQIRVQEAPPPVIDGNQGAEIHLDNYFIDARLNVPVNEHPSSPPRTRTPTPPAPEPPLDPADDYTAQVLEIIPDVTPEHVYQLIQTHLPTHGGGVVEQVLHVLFEDPHYPRVDKKGKRKADEPAPDDNRGHPKTRIDYASIDRLAPRGIVYDALALEQLQTDFPYVPKPHIRATLLRNKYFYAPTHLALAAEITRGTRLPYTRKKVPYRATGKGRALLDDAFEEERRWLLQRLAEGAPKPNEPVNDKMDVDEAAADGDGIECGCCFTDYPFDKMVQCPEGHLFCTECMTSYASNKLGSHDANIICMDQSGCKLPFPPSELKRFLSEKLLELYERVIQRKEIEAAGLDGLEECPFCEYKVVIENDTEKLFRCENQGCGAVTCRKCKKQDHLPKSCEEADKDKVLDAQHAIEEAMSRSLSYAM
ncbi:hypothetical protein HGRIS_011885 [Hohenbuehelia grisea]|uniref:RING-type domain-containing protein n=1 Tax=Hohenbuehelia grisea TaxID=104357 RepID=A0ABR3JX90_9AGAR